MSEKPPHETGAIHGAAVLFGIAGAAALIFALVMETTTETGYGMDRETIYNLGLLQNQMMVFQAGLAAILAGLVLWGVDRLGR